MSRLPSPPRLDTHKTMNPMRDQHFERALCREVDPETFFPTPLEIEKTQDALEICSRCEHQLPCLVLALRNRIEYGIWGGYTEAQRRQYWKATA